MQPGQLPQVRLGQVLLLAQFPEPLREAVQFLGHIQHLRHVKGSNVTMLPDLEGDIDACMLEDGLLMLGMIKHVR